MERRGNKRETRGELEKRGMHASEGQEGRERGKEGRGKTEGGGEVSETKRRDEVDKWRR